LNSLFQKLTDIAQLALDEAMLKRTLAESVHDTGLDYYAYLNVQPVGAFAVSNYPMEWQRRYFAQGYINIDPVVALAKRKMKPFIWAASSLRECASARVHQFYSEAGDFGIRSGVSIPIPTAFGHMSILTLASRTPSLAFSNDIDHVAATSAVAQLHAKLEQREVQPTARMRIELKAKQAICLKWSAEGKCMKAIAMIEGMSYHNVNFHLNNARKALDAGTLPQATALATRLKLI